MSNTRTLPATSSKVSRALPAQATSQKAADAILTAQVGVSFRTVVARIDAWLGLADEAQRAYGMVWYAEGLAWCRRASERHMLPLSVVATVVAALSPRCKWDVNVRFAAWVLLGSPSTTRPRGAMLPENIARAQRVMSAARSAQVDGCDGEAVSRLALEALGSAPKVNAFQANLSGNESMATVDVWATRAALLSVEYKRNDNEAKAYCEGALGRKGVYSAVALAYATVARRHGLTTAQVQAIVWCAVRGTGE